MFKTGCVWCLKEAVLLGTTHSRSFPGSPHTYPQSLALPALLSGSRWNVVSCSTWRYFGDYNLLLLLYPSPASWSLSASFQLSCSPCVSLSWQVVSLRACRTPEAGRMRGEPAEMAASVYQGGQGVQSLAAFPSLLSQMVFQMPNPRFHSPAQLLFDGISSSLFVPSG